jgi:hypothetical protein
MIWFIVPTITLILVLTFLYHFKKTWRRTIVFFGSSLGIGATVIAAVFGVLGLRESTEQHGASVRLNQKQASFYYLKEWKTVPQPQVREVCRLIRGIPPQEAHKIFQNNHEYADAVRGILAYFEELGLAIKHSYADEETLCSLLQEPVMTYHSDLQPWMDWYKNYRHIPRTFENYDWLYQRWKNGCPAPSNQ